MSIKPLSEVSITLTDKALSRLKDFYQAGKGVRLGLTKTGCSGYAYVVKVDDWMDGDEKYTENGMTFYIHEDAKPLLQGANVDFVKFGLNEKFIFQNPNEKGACGCGESFTI